MKTKIEQLQEENENLILCFKIGRDGRFHNPGHLSFYGENKISDSMFIDNLFTNEDETQYTDGNGKEVGLPVENDGTGAINIDNDYNTTYAIHVADLTKEEFLAIKNRGRGFFGLSMPKFDEISEYYEEIEEEN